MNPVLVGSRRLDLAPAVLVKTTTFTLAQINAGTAMIKPFGAVRYRPVGFTLVVAGTFLTSTDIRLSDTASTPVDIATLAIAQAVDGAQLGPGSTGITLGAGFGARLTAGKGIQIRQTGTAATGGTSIKVTLMYEVASGLSVGAPAA